MLEIFNPENDNKRLVVLFVVLIVVIVFSLAYRGIIITLNDLSNNQNITDTSGEQQGVPTRNTAQVPNVNVPVSTLPQPPAPPTEDDLKKMSEEAKTKTTPAGVSGKPVSQ